MRTRLIGLPGTGKTTKLLEMLDNLLKQYKPDQIIFASFSNAAVNEAVERVQEKFDLTKSDLPFFRTLHSLCLKLVRMHNYKLGSNPAQPLDFTTFFDDYLRSHPDVADLIEDLQIVVGTTMYIPEEDKDNPISLYTLSNDPGTYFISVFAYLYSNFGCTPLHAKQFKPHLKEFLEVVDISNRYKSTYITSLIKIEQSWKQYKIKKDLFEFSELLAIVYQKKIVPPTKIVIVDEFQDSSPLQGALVNFWAEKMEKTIVAGDPNQAIYGFNGASPEFLEGFDHDNDLLLHKSWRVPQNVILYAQQILNNKWTKQMTSAKEIEGRVWETDLEGVPWDEYESVYVLARTRGILDQISSELKEKGIIQSSTDTLVRLSYAVYYAFSRDTTITFESLYQLWEKDNQPFVHRLFDQDMDRIFQKAATDMPQKEVNRDMLKSLLNVRSTPDLESKIQRRLNQLQFDAIQKLIWNNAVPSKGDGDHIKLMTLHSSKGKEADLVVIINASSWYERNRDIDEDEERRLFFVAATRTKQDLIIINHNDLVPTKFLPITEDMKQLEVKETTTAGSLKPLFS